MMRMCGALCAALVLVVGCGGKDKVVKAEGEQLATPKPAPTKLIAYHAQLGKTWDDAGIEYLGVERQDLTPDEHAATFRDLAPERSGQLLPVDAPEVPDRLRAPQTFTLLTLDGPVTLAPSAGVMLYGGASEDHFVHTITPPPALSAAARDGAMIAVPANPALPAAARVHAGQPVALDSAAGKKIEAAVRGLLATQLASPPEGEGHAAPATIAEFNPAEQLQIVRGSFGDKKALLVAYAMPRSLGGEDITMGHVSGLYLAEEDGSNFMPVVASSTFESAGVVALVDLEGDGVDEIVFSMSYYEGGYTYLARLYQGKIETIELAGDGA